VGGAHRPRVPEPGEHTPGPRAIPPLVPIFVNAFIAPQPTARRCFQFGQHIARVVAKSSWAVGIIATGGLSHFPELLLGRVGETDTVFDRKLIHLMERGEHEPLLDLTADELHKTGSHEFLNWMVLLGAITPARADVRYFGELPRINLAAVEWRTVMSRYAINSLLYHLKKDPTCAPVSSSIRAPPLPMPSSLTKNAPRSSRATCGRSTSSVDTSTW
jgi:hypothetical protein